MAEKPARIAVAVVCDAGRYLVGVRSRGVTLAGLAEFPGGRIEAGETPQAAAIRECREETGVEVTVGEPLLSTVHQYDHGLVELHFFDCRPVDQHPEPRPPFRWVDSEELAALEFPAANAPLMKKLAAPSEIARKGPLNRSR